MSEIDVQHNGSQNRFEANVAGGTAMVEYTKKGSDITFTHTEVPEAAAGQGVAQALVRKALSYARDNKLRVWPECSYVASFVKRNRDYDDILHPDYTHD
jgi:predicted GNAT family acetyltransferase